MINVKGDQKEIDKAVREITKRTGGFTEKLKQEVYKSALNIESRAKLNVTSNGAVDNGRLRASITSEVDPAHPSANVHTTVFYAPYVEFGTGLYAKEYLSDKPSDLKRYAMEFFVNGKGRMPARPFLFPASEAERPQLLKRLKDLNI